MQEKKAEQRAKSQLEISPTSDTKKDAKNQKMKRMQQAQNTKDSDKSDEEADTTLEKMEAETSKEQGIPELPTSDSERSIAKR